MDRILNRNFEADSDWTFTHPIAVSCGYSTNKARSGSRSVECVITTGVAEGNNATASQVLVTGNKVNVPISVYVNAELVQTANGYIELECVWYDQGGSPTSLGRENLNAYDGQDVWTQIDFGSFTADGATNKIEFIFHYVTGPPGITQVKLYLDDAASAVYVARSSVLTFMDQLKTFMQGVDDNLGSIFITNKRWKAVGMLKNDATLIIDTAGIIDDITDIGDSKTRFWVMTPQIKSKQLTNKSIEYENIIEITGFFARDDSVEQDSQEDALNKALVELVGALSTRDAQFGALKITANGYLGYLDFPPIIYLPVRNAILAESTIQGHAGQIQMRYFEEVAQYNPIPIGD